MPLADAVSGGWNGVAEEGEFAAEESVQMRLVWRVDGNEAFPFLLVELLFLEHADFVVRSVHAPVFDVYVEFRQVEIRADGMAVEDAVALIISVVDVVGDEPVGDDALAIGLDEGAGFGGDGFAEFHLGVKVAAVEIDLVEAGVAEAALEGLVAAGVLFGGGLAPAAKAFVAGVFLLETHGLTDGGGGGVCSAADVVFNTGIVGEIIEVGQMSGGVVAKTFECFERVLLNLRMGVAHGDGQQRGDGGHGISAEGRELGDGRGRQAADFGGGEAQELEEFRQDGGISAAPEFERALDGLVMEVAVHGLYLLFVTRR